MMMPIDSMNKRRKLDTTSSSSSSTRHDVFLSFRGKDTRKTFTSHLFQGLKQQGCRVFHDTLLKRGESVRSGLFKSIDDSKLSIVVFSRNYAGSRWCLDELVNIIDCRRSNPHQRIVLPVFYDVEPYDVRNQTGPYAAAFADHQRTHLQVEVERVNQWKAALNEAGNLSGLHLQNDSNGDEADFVKRIVQKVELCLDRKNLHVADYPVGLDLHLQKLDHKLRWEIEDDVRIVAIWGLGGLGKTTIAKALFNNHYRSFHGSCFLADVRETAQRPDGVVTLQERLISQVLKQDATTKIPSSHRGIEVIKEKVWCRKVLIVLDDVDSHNQLKNLAIDVEGLHKGSRVIITTRDKSCLNYLSDTQVYEPKALDALDSLSLFSCHAFGRCFPKQGYEEVSKNVVEYAGGLPLVLETLGSYMRVLKTADEWRHALKRLIAIPHDDVQQKLRLSFDSLRIREQNLFLDIVVSFVGWTKGFVLQVLAENARDDYPRSEFRVLLDRCLVKINKDGRLWVHDMLRVMGRAIAREESWSDPKKRRRLLDPEDVLHVLKEPSGAEAIETITLWFPTSNEEHALDIKAFANLRNLRLINISHLKLVGSNCNNMQCLDNLKVLRWYDFPLTCLPSHLSMQNLVVLYLRKSRLRQLWKGKKVLNKLRILSVIESYDLTNTPDLSGVVNLEELWLTDCKNLVELHHSIQHLPKLHLLEASGCHKLFEARNFGRSFFYRLNLFLPTARATDFHFQRWPSSLTEMNLSNCNLMHLPVEIGNIVSLEWLDLSGNKFRSIPATIKHLRRLKFLYVDNCSELKVIVDLPDNLEFLRVWGSRSLETIQNNVSKSEGSRIIHVAVVSEGTKLMKMIRTNKEREQLLSRMMVLRVYDPKEAGIPHWFNYQGVGPFLSFVVPQHPNKTSIKGVIVCVICQRGNNAFQDYMIANAFNKTKNSWFPSMVSWFDETCMQISYQEFSKHGFAMDGGDEIEVVFLGTSAMKGCGLCLVYNQDENVEMTMDDNQLAIQYSPNVNLYSYDQDMNPVKYVSPEMMGRINPWLHDLKHFDEEALLVLLKEKAAGGDNRIVYHLIADTLRFHNSRLYSSHLEEMENAIKGPV